MHSTEIPLSTLRREPLPEDAPRVGISTLGCKVNSYESEFISEVLRTRQWKVVPSSQIADLYIINTCTVTREADRQARQEVRRAVRRNPEAMIVVTGCYAQMDPDSCAEIPGVDLVLGNERKLELDELLPDFIAGALPKVMVGDLNENIGLPDQLIGGFVGQTRAFLQIQQGCDQGCTFCIIHRARGPGRSFPLSLVRRQAERLAINGYPEIVLCGVDLGSWGEDLDSTGMRGERLPQLIRELLSIDTTGLLSDGECEPFRIRLSSIDPVHIGDELVELLATEPRLCRHLHISLQSGNTLILKRMKRRYTADFVYERVQWLRSKVPDLVLSADIMVGFPTETEDQFDDTRSMIQALEIAFPHVFPYSERTGTPAARIPLNRQVPVPIRKDRARRLRETGTGLRSALEHRQIGRSAWILPESADPRTPGYLKARATNYISSLVSEKDVIAGRWVLARYDAHKDGNLYASPIA